MHIPEMNEWRSSGRYTDVVIEVDGRKFNCHRVALGSASKYFDTILGDRPPNDTHRILSLQGVVSAGAFADVLDYIYTGNVVITSENVYHLLRATHYLQLNPHLESDCTSFIENKLPFPYMFDAARFACKNEKNVLLYHIANYISCHLENFSETSDFLELPFEVIRLIIDLSTLNEEIVMKAIMQWIYHKCSDRWRYFSQLSHLGMMIGVHPFVIESNALSLIPSVISSEDVVSYMEDLKRTRIGKSLIVYWLESHSVNILRVVIDQGVRCNYLQSFINCVGVKKVVFNRSLIYTLGFIRSQSNELGILQFCSHEFNGRSMKMLMSPYTRPIYRHIFYHGTHLCGLPKMNRLYFYAVCMNLLLVYDCDRDIWYRLTKLLEPRTWPTIATCETSNSMYLVCSNVGSGPYTVQIYDCCAEKWTKLPKSNHTRKSPVWPAVCVYEGKLYIYNKSYCMYEVYDPSKQEWSTSKQNPYIGAVPSPRVIPYGDALWLFSAVREGQDDKQKDFYIVYLYRPGSDSWQKCPLIRAAIEKNGDITNHDPCFLEAILL